MVGDACSRRSRGYRASMADDHLQEVLGERLQRVGWKRSEPGQWRIEADEGRLVGTLEERAGEYVARVLRHPTGPSAGPDPVEANGPTTFVDPDEAVAYVEANLGLGS